MRPTADTGQRSVIKELKDMGIVVCHGVRQDLPNLSMSNGLTCVFIDILAVAMSALAMSDSEKRIAAWIASHDQAIFGGGVVDFDVCDFPWQVATFGTDKTFVLKAIRAAVDKFEWHKLWYLPNEDLTIQSLGTFQSLVEHFELEHILPISEWAWQFGDEPNRFEKCSKHLIYLHSHGCVLCNGAPAA